MKTVNSLLMFFQNLPTVLLMLCLPDTCYQSNNINNTPGSNSRGFKMGIWHDDDMFTVRSNEHKKTAKTDYCQKTL